MDTKAVFALSLLSASLSACTLDLPKETVPVVQLPKSAPATESEPTWFLQTESQPRVFDSALDTNRRVPGAPPFLPDPDDEDSPGEPEDVPIDEAEAPIDDDAPPVKDDSILEGLVAYWGFADDQGAQVIDGSTNENHGDVCGTLWTSDGRRGGALSFDGEAYVEAGSLDIPGKALTLAAWVYFDPEAALEDQRIISKSMGPEEADHFWMLSLTGDEEPQLRFRLRTVDSDDTSTTTTLVSSDSLIAGQWAHVAGTYDGGEMTLYLNGERIASMDKTGTIAQDPTVNAFIGANHDGYGTWQGRIDEVFVAGNALDAATVVELMASSAR